MPWGRPWGGYPYPIMLCNITQNAMGQTPGGVPCQVQLGGVPCWGGTLPGGYPDRVHPWPGQDRGWDPGRVPPPARSGWGVGPRKGTPPARSGWGGTLPGGTQLGQQKEYSLHGRRYASCVHAGGLSCLRYYFFSKPLTLSWKHCHLCFGVLVTSTLLGLKARMELRAYTVCPPFAMDSSDLPLSAIPAVLLVVNEISLSFRMITGVFGVSVLST